MLGGNGGPRWGSLPVMESRVGGVADDGLALDAAGPTEASPIRRSLKPGGGPKADGGGLSTGTGEGASTWGPGAAAAAVVVAAAVVTAAAAVAAGAVAASAGCPLGRAMLVVPVLLLSVSMGVAGLAGGSGRVGSPARGVGNDAVASIFARTGADAILSGQPSSHDGL